MVSLPVLLATGGCGLFDNLVDDSVEPIDIDVGLINEGVAEPDQNHVTDLSLAPSVSAANPTWTSAPGGDAEEWGGTLALDSMARAGGLPTIVVLEVSDLVVQNEGGPFSLNVALVGDVVYSTEIGGGPPVPPPECTIEVDPANPDALAHAADLLACIHAWVDANGSPADFSLSVTGSARAAGFAYGATYLLYTEETFQMDCSYDVVLPTSVIDMANSLTIEELSIAGYGGAVNFGLELMAFANVYGPDGTLATTASLDQRIEAGTLYFVETEIDIDPEDVEAATLTVATNVATIQYQPAGVSDWMLDTYDALIGAGWADACWGEIHDDVPNTGIVRWTLVGSADPEI
jgi:hypothetical protein